MLDIRKAAVVGLGTIVLLAGALGCAGAAAQPAGSGASPALFNREEYRYSSGTGSAARLMAHRYSVLVLDSDDARDVTMLHRYNPSLKILMYQYVGYSVPADPHAAVVCTSYEQDLAHHRNWFASTSTGGLVAGDSHYIMNLANAGYQQACITHAVALAKQGGFNGVFLDGVGSRLAYDEPHGFTVRAVQYPTVRAWQSAMYSLLTYAGATVHAAGLQLFANIGNAPGTKGLWQKWNGPLDGAMEEYWTDGGLGLQQELYYWRSKLADISWSEAHGKFVLLHSYGTTEQDNTFGLAAMMLVADGHLSYSTSNGNEVSYEKWYSEYTTAERLGPALGAYTHRRTGVDERKFANGIVLVNPTLHRVRRFALGGRYSGSGLTRVRMVTLAPLSGLILTDAG